jgi:hypothetical protein
MTVKELKNIINNLPENQEVKFIRKKVIESSYGEIYSHPYTKYVELSKSQIEIKTENNELEILIKNL